MTHTREPAFLGSVPWAAAPLNRFLQGLKQEFSEKGQKNGNFWEVRQKSAAFKTRFWDPRVRIIQHQYFQISPNFSIKSVNLQLFDYLTQPRFSKS